ncbi:MAG: hypothetical protein KAW93_00700 [Methanogenium sp.]|nr:hypothetical protein [Methanogenium sp.]
MFVVDDAGVAQDLNNIDINKVNKRKMKLIDDDGTRLCKGIDKDILLHKLYGR